MGAGENTSLLLFTTMSDLGQIKKKIERFCAYRDRCAGETEARLVQLGALPAQVKELMKWLKDENFINEERFAHSFARGKFNQNKWGRQRIALELRARKIDPGIIQSAIKSIDNDNYLEKARALALKKLESLSSSSSEDYIKKQKTAAYLVAKGFEMEIAFKIAGEVSGSP